MRATALTPPWAKHLMAAAVALTVGACAGASTVPMSQDVFQVTSGAAPICGPDAAQRVAVRHAAVETIRRGRERFIILGAEGGSEVVGHSPVVVQNWGGGMVTASGGEPLRASRQGLMERNP
jgi:hypothetical protein